MDKEKLERANFLQKEIRKINSLIKDIYDDFEIKVQSNNTTCIYQKIYTIILSTKMIL